MMNEKGVFLTVIIPCYNEEGNLRRGVLREVFNFLKRKDFSWEVIISDDGSTDLSRELVKNQVKKLSGFRLLENPHGGKPSTLNFGIKYAKGKYILFTDMDQSTPIGELNKLFPYLSRGYDVVIGSRGLERNDFPLYRKIGAAIFSTFRSALILSEISDTQCGFKLFRKESLLKTFPRLEYFKKYRKVTGWKVTSFDVELLHLLKKEGYKIKEVKVQWNDKDVSKSKGKALKKYFKESKEMFMQILRVKFNDLRGIYNHE